MDDLKLYSTYRPHLHKDYVCKDDSFHDYGHVKGENGAVKVELCIRCGHEIRFNKDRETGKIDSIRYGETHMLYFLQRTHPFYAKYYPESAKRGPSKKREHKEIMNEMEREVKEEMRNWGKITSYRTGYGHN